MGRGNVCVHGPCEGLYYIDTDDFKTYRHDDSAETKLLGELDRAALVGGSWVYDAEMSERELEDIVDIFFYQLSVSIHLVHPHAVLGSGPNRRRGGRGKDG